MRRVRADLSYKEITRDIINQTFDSWQLTAREEREGIHRFINRVVSLGQEFDKELSYVENMFFPGKMDLSEEFMLYKTYPEAPASDLYYSGMPISGAVTKVNTSDELIAGEIDTVKQKSSLSGIVEIASMVAKDTENAHILGEGYIFHINLLNGDVSSSGAVSTADSVVEEALFDINHRYYTIDQPFLSDTVSLTTSGDVAIPFEVYTSDELEGVWNPEFDVDGDGVIWDVEKSAINSALGLNMNSTTPEEWTEISWADVDSDGTISDQDYTSVRSAIPSVSPEKYGVVRVPHGYNGVYLLEYTPDESYMIDIHRAGPSYGSRYTKTNMEDFHKVTYDEHTGVYYAIESGRRTLKALTYEDDLDNIAGDVLIHVNLWDVSCRMVDIDIHSGYIFIMVTDGSEYRLIYDDIWREYVESIELSATIDLPDSFSPTGMSITEDGYVVCYEADRVELFSMARDRYADLNGVAYFNIRRDYTDSEGNPYVTVPHRVFNSFDSFAYSFGIERPWGKDNMFMRKAVYDFYVHHQSNSTIGMSYGLTRELGFENVTTVSSGEIYYLPSPLSSSGTILINEEEVDVINVDDNEFTLSGSMGTLKVEYGHIVTPDERILASTPILDIEGYYLDGEHYPVRITQSLFIDNGTIEPTIESRSLADKVYLEEQGLMVSGEVTSEMLTMVEDSEDNSPFIYRNSIPNKTNIDIWRLTYDPLVPTIMSPSTSGLVTEDTDSEVTI
jgi:hypothetical protein